MHCLGFRSRYGAKLYYWLAVFLKERVDCEIPKHKESTSPVYFDKKPPDNIIPYLSGDDLVCFFCCCWVWDFGAVAVTYFQSWGQCLIYKFDGQLKSDVRIYLCPNIWTDVISGRVINYYISLTTWLTGASVKSWIPP